MSTVEASAIDCVFEESTPLPLHSTSNNIDAFSIDGLMMDRNLDAQFMASIGSTNACLKKHVFDDATVVTVKTTDDESISDDSCDNETESDMESDLGSDPDDEDALDEFMSSAAHEWFEKL